MNMSISERVKRISEESDAVITNSHLVYANGGHGSDYIDKDTIHSNPRLVAELCGYIARHFCELSPDHEYDTVIGPEKGGIILAQWTAYGTYDTWKPPRARIVHAIFAEKVGRDNSGDIFALTRGYEKYVTAKRVLIVDDVLTNGSSVRKVAGLVKTAGGIVIGVGAIYNRGSVTAQEVCSNDLYVLLDMPLDVFLAKECPHCAEYRPMNIRLGKGKSWLETEAGQDWLARGGSIEK